MVSIGLVAFADDMETEVGNLYSIIRPEGFVIDNNSEACQKNGITQEKAMAFGIPIKTALQALDHWVYRSEYIGFYNSEFDVGMLAGEAELLGRKCYLDRKKVRCLKIAATQWLKLPPRPGYTDYAWPKLEQAYEWMFNQPPAGAHNAIHDARNTAWLAFAAVKQGLWKFSDLS